MANIKSAAKRARQSVKRELQNSRSLSAVKTHLKKFRAEVESKNLEQAKSAGSTLSSALDKAVKTGRLHGNTANRHKSAIAKSLAKLSA